ncbi:putative Protein kinase [Zostera marina]|uniref:Protein kinase domain-containing protein n=1 Tax=Zostera marina TaxID=29655 RepID=A0A0K9NZF6_ZOSMR|nr:putative Protein kinase [Zostera marina]
MENRARCTLLLYLEFWVIIAVSGGFDEGFISIDCGQENSYQDPITRFPYVSDSDFIDTGENHKIPTNTKAANQQGYHLRSFPNGTRNCYRLQVVKDKKYLIRASFFYANYDGLNRTPQFDLYLDINLWKSINLFEVTSYYFTEILAYASRNWMSVCLVNTDSGTPFITSLELRPLDDYMYPLVMPNQTSVLFRRRNIQPIAKKTIRYPNDIYDRFWSPYTSDSLETLSTTLYITPCIGCKYPVPSDVLQTCGVPVANGSTINITLHWPFLNNNIRFRKIAFIIHYAEIESPPINDESRSYYYLSRNTKYNLNGPFNYPSYLESGYLHSSEPWTSTSDYFNFVLRKADNSTHPPILSAVEIYEIKESTTMYLTNEEEVEAMMEIKEFYKLNKNWQGDPCAWEGVECNSNPSITSLNLGSLGLNGEISNSLIKLKQLKSLDLSNNHLQGTIPSFLAYLPNLQFLKLSNNNLNGLIPIDLQQKSNLLILSVEGNPHLCYKLEECERNSSKKTVIAIFAVVCSVIVVLLIVFLVWKVKNRTPPKTIINRSEEPIHLGNTQISYHDLVTMTNNFKKIIGEGGFGKVYHGIHKNGTQVAVKMLSSSSAQGAKEFQMEANLLTRIHHKNLVSLVGYCNEKDHLALVYEYMEGGSLKKLISGQRKNSTVISWGDRMKIAFETAQGFDYLHRGCQPAIVHRDVKTDNILLSSNFDVKIADFGLSKIFENESNATMMATQVMGTLGYIDPQYYDTQMLNEKSDVYSFGVVLLELITGQSPIVFLEGQKIHLRKLIEPLLERGEIDKIVDPKLNGKYNTKSVRKILDIAYSCVSPSSDQRPLMFDIVKPLKECLEYEMPQGSITSIASTSSNFSSDIIPAHSIR